MAEAIIVFKVVVKTFMNSQLTLERVLTSIVRYHCHDLSNFLHSHSTKNLLLLFGQAMIQQCLIVLSLIKKKANLTGLVEL